MPTHINGKLIVKVFPHSNVARLEDGTYYPLDYKGVDAYEH